jgi:hypothetical protein
MTQFTDTANRPQSGLDVAALDRTDRILLGGCAVVWLTALGAAVAATVALVDLTNGHQVSTAESGTPWFLYSVIGVSAAVIVAAIPLLLRARRGGEEEPLTPVERRLAQRDTPGPQAPAAPARAVDAPTEKLRVPSAIDSTNSGRLPRMLQPSAPAALASPMIDRLWLRSATSIGCAMGVSTLLISAATYLMAVDSDTAAWVVYGVAGVVTAAMIAIPWYFLRELRTEIAR